MNGTGMGWGCFLVLFFIGAPFLFWFLGFGVNGIIGGECTKRVSKGKRAGAGAACPGEVGWRRLAVHSREILRASPAVRACPMKTTNGPQSEPSVSSVKDRRESELFLRSFLSLLSHRLLGRHVCIPHQTLINFSCCFSAFLLWPHDK